MEKITDKLKEIWLKIWGNKEDFKNGNKLQKFLLLLKRTVVVYAGLWLVMFLASSFISLIQSNEFLACAGKDVCIFKGPSTELKTYRIKSFKLNDGSTILIVIGLKNYDFIQLAEHIIYNGYTRKYILPSIREGIKEKYAQPVYKINAYKYDTKRNRFKKINFKLASLEFPIGITSENKAVYTLYNNFINSETIHILDLKTQLFKNTELCNFSDKCKQKPNNLRFVKPYTKDKVIVMTENNKLLYNDFLLKKKEYMYIFDLKNLTFKKLPDFAIPLKYYTDENDIIVLDNGDIIILGRHKDYREIFYDHIEIYDAKQNKFIAQTNTDFYRDNIFTINQKNGDVLFVNQNSTYNFNSAKNKFEKASSYESGKNKVAMYLLQNKLKEVFNIYLYTPYADKVKYIKLPDNKYLITCGDTYFDFPYYKNPNGVCKKTLIYDYENNTIKEGPKFLYTHNKTNIVPVDENTYIAGGFISDKDGKNPSYNEHVQIIKVKK